MVKYEEQKAVMRMKTGDTKSAAKVLEVLTVLMRNYAIGFSSTDLVKETGFTASDITRYVNTLENSGFAERIPETNRIRPSTKHVQFAIQVMRSVEQAKARINEIETRLLRG